MQVMRLSIVWLLVGMSVGKERAALDAAMAYFCRLRARTLDHTSGVMTAAPPRSAITTVGSSGESTHPPMSANADLVVSAKKEAAIRKTGVIFLCILAPVFIATEFQALTQCQ
jgi:hypothetical protein